MYVCVYVYIGLRSLLVGLVHPSKFYSLLKSFFFNSGWDWSDSELFRKGVIIIYVLRMNEVMNDCIYVCMYKCTLLTYTSI